MRVAQEFFAKNERGFLHVTLQVFNVDISKGSWFQMPAVNKSYVSTVHAIVRLQLECTHR